MKKMTLSGFWIAGVFAGVLSGFCVADERVILDAGGRIVTVPVQATPEGLANPWPAAWEDAFVTRRSGFIRQYVGKSGVNTALENEKQGYPPTLLAFCAGDRQAALAALQSEDAMAGEFAHTQGIDYYWCFTLKGQMRKYFFLGQYLDSAYRKRMRDGAEAWVASDPRPMIELALFAGDRDPGVAVPVTVTLKQMWRDAAGLKKMADEASADFDRAPTAPGANHYRVFSEFIRAFAEKVGREPPADTAGWLTWYGDLTQGDWQIFEEYDRRTNPRPHPQFGLGTGPVGTDFSAQTRGGVVDPRCTDNLRGMREVSVYLMAEEVGSEEVCKRYKARLRRTAVGFLTVGNGEWDSPAYLSHTASAYINLYDFAKDPEVRGYAKAILDFVSTSAAIKYRRGAFCGPNCRDYGTVSGSPGPATMIHFWAGPPDEITEMENDVAHYATSGYRPPVAVVALARKELSGPVELLAGHPNYQAWLPGSGSAPRYHETTFLGRTFQFGSLVEGGSYDVNGCKLLVENARGGADYVVPSSQSKGSVCTSRAANDRLAQCRNALVWLRPADQKPVEWNWAVPADTQVETEGGVTFLKWNKTWAAVHPVNATYTGLDDKRKAAFKAGGAILAGTANSTDVSGFAWEVADEGDYAAFKAGVKEKSKLDLGALGQGKVVFTASSGARVGLQIGETVRVWRDGAEHDLAKDHVLLWRTVSGPPTVDLPWQTGTLRVTAGGHAFTGTLDPATGLYTSRSEPAGP
jgi:hypothetical protein